MKRREFVQNVGLASAAGLLVGGSANADTPAASDGTQSTGTQAAKPGAAATQSASAGSQSQEVPAYAGSLQTSDGTVVDADGNAQPGFAHTSSEAQQADPKAPYQMPLTQEEQDIMDGKKGPELAKVMKIVVGHGNAFGAPKLVELGGAPHCSLYTGTDYMKPMIDLFQECADAGL
jgi:hypothetical protein